MEYKWTRLLRNNPELLADFNSYIDDEIARATRTVIDHAAGMHEVVAVRWLIQELEKLKALVNHDPEAQQLNIFATEDSFYGGDEPESDDWC